jgi:hypothetical protein
MLKEFDFAIGIPVLVAGNSSEFLLRGYFIRMLKLGINYWMKDLLMKIVL